MKIFILSFILMISSLATAEDNALFAFATVKTSMGDIRLKLFKKDAPRTVENFLGLASGTKHFRDIKTGKKVKETRFYRDMIFHKVHPLLGIQTGCPWGNGKGWPGYSLKEEKNELKFNKPYLVAMAKIAGSDNSVGSQFFITTQKAPHLDEKYTVFGEVISGQEVVKKISRTKRDAMMRPITPVQMIEVIVEK